MADANSDKILVITTQREVRDLVSRIQQSKWLALDAEFAPYAAGVALVQLAWDGGAAAVDVPAASGIGPLCALLERQDLEKITHSGTDDYRMLRRQYHCWPKGVFDTQVAAAFVGHRYPARLETLLGAEIGVELNKGLAVSDWTRRPLTKEQIDYAMSDVVYLKPLRDKLVDRLNGAGMSEWAHEETEQLLSEDFLHQSESVKHWKVASALTTDRERVFLLRCIVWRDEKATKEGIDVEAVLPTTALHEVVRSIRGGEQAIRENTKIPRKVRRAYGEELLGLWDRPIEDGDLQRLREFPTERPRDMDRSMQVSFLHAYVQHRAQQTGINAELLGSHGDIGNAVRFQAAYRSRLLEGWRTNVLGPAFARWVRYEGKLDVSMTERSITIATSAPSRDG